MSAEKLETEVRQAQILRVAMQLVSEDGLKALSLANIARRVGVVPSALYRHFKSKEALPDALLESIAEKLLDNVNLVCRETSDPVERLRRLLFLHVKLIRENRGIPGIPRIIFSPEFFATCPRRKKRLYGAIREYLNRIGGIIDEGRQQGLVHPACVPETLSMLFLGLIQPAASLWYLSDGAFDVTKHAERAWKVFRETLEGGKEPGEDSPRVAGR